MAACALGPAGAQPPPTPPAPLTAILQPYGGLTDQQRAAVARGDADVRTLQTPDRNEVALLGVVAVAVPREYYTRLARAARPLLASRARAAWGTLSTPASVADVAALTLGEDDAKALRTCRPLHCGIKLPADVMAQFRSAVNWSRDARPQVDSLARRWLVDLVDAYREFGDAAMPVYDDTHVGERAAAGFAALLARDAPLLRDAPAFARFLAGAPSADLPGVSTTLHWSVDRRPGLAPIVSAAQLSAYVPPSGPDMTIVADKQLYASHYFDALLDVTIAVDASATDGGTYVAMLRRTRFDNPPPGGLFGMRGRIVGKLRDALRASLLRMKRSLEASYASRSGAS